MAYSPKSQGALELKALFNDLTTAQQDWETYGRTLGGGYTDAWKSHAGILKGIGDSYKESAQAEYFVLSLLAVAVTGGIIGGLIAPWVAGAGTAAASQILRTGASETAQGVGTGIVGSQMPSGPSSDAYKPVVKDPSEFKDDLLIELGTAYFYLRQELEQFMKFRDGDNTVRKDITPALITARVDRIKQSPLSKSPDRLPDRKEIAKVAEIAMWLAWGQRRDFDYWKKRYDHLDTARQGPTMRYDAYADQVNDMDPIMFRLDKLGIGGAVTRSVKMHYHDNNHMHREYTMRFLDLVKLKSAGDFINGTLPYRDFLKYVSLVIYSPYTALAALAAKNPLSMPAKP
jgi:hypothetical protein